MNKKFNNNYKTVHKTTEILRCLSYRQHLLSFTVRYIKLNLPKFTVRYIKLNLAMSKAFYFVDKPFKGGL